MMNYHVMTLFPDMIRQGMNTSIIGRAMEKGLLSLDCIDIRAFTKEKHGHVDDAPYGGGAGMVMQAQPVYDCYLHICSEIHAETKPRVIYLTPQGKTFDQKMSVEFAKEEHLIFLCGHYEGIDERVLNKIVTDEISIGDYVLTGGELAAMVLMDSISRNIPGVLHNDISAETESFSDGLLEYPQYTRPEVFEGERVPEVLLSGHHANIAKWRREQSILRTYERRPDLFHQVEFDKKDRKFIKEQLGLLLP